MAGLFETVTRLQPRSLTYWDMAAWHMAWNASTAAMQNEKQPSEALRIRAQRGYFQLGRDFLERGILNNPDRHQLYLQLGILLRDKFEDHCAAAEAFLKAAEFPDAPPYVERFAGYEMAKCPGREREAYEHLRRLYEQGENQRLPSLVNLLREMENKLDIPAEGRVE
jgi:tetratricopeptide (TPR) repeat protein